MARKAGILVSKILLRSITLLLLSASTLPASSALPLLAQRSARPAKPAAVVAGVGSAGKQPAAVGSGARPLAAARLDLQAPWTPVGPQRTSSPAYGSIAGRVLSIAVDPADATGNTVYLGTTGGGVWKSTNALSSANNVSFAPVTDAVPSFDPASGWLSSSTIGAVSVQPAGTGVILAGSGDPSGGFDSYYGDGILRSADGGKTWKLIVQSSDGAPGQPFSFFGLSFAAFAWSTSAPNLVVAAVSSSLQGGIVNAGYNGSSAMGLYYSQDAGQTWYLSTITDGPFQTLQSPTTRFSGFSGNAVTSVVWNPQRQAFFAAVRYHGYYRSTDGVTWTRLSRQPGNGLDATVCPANPNQSGSTSCPIYRGALAVQPVSGDTFALTTDGKNVDQGLWQDACGFINGACGNGSVTFAGQIASSALEMGDGSRRIAQASYDLWLQAVPSRADTLLFAGTRDIFRCSLAGGCQWRNATNTNTCAAAKVGPAQHAVDWVHGSSTLFFGNDAGLWRTTDAVAQGATACNGDDAAHFDNLNSGLAFLADTSALAQDPANVSTLLAATGNGGTLASNGPAGEWQQVVTPANPYGLQPVAIDPVSGQNWFAGSGNAVSVSECTLGAACNAAGFGTAPVIGDAQVLGDGDALNHPAPWILDPQNSAKMIVGTCRVWRGPANGSGWSVANTMSRMLDGNNAPSCQSGPPGNAQIRSIAASGTVAGQTAGGERVYAGMAGTLDGAATVPGHLYGALLTPASNALTTWSDLSLSPVANDPLNKGRFNRAGFGISAIAIDPHDATGQTLYVGLNGFSGNGLLKSVSQPLVYMSTDAGQHWTSIHANLPIPAPVHSILVDPGNASIVYVATDLGVFVTGDVTQCAPTGNCWNLYGTGLPNSPVMQLLPFVGGGQSLLQAATYGRGIWQASLASVPPKPDPPSGSLSASSLIFGAQAVGTASAAQSLVLTNTGTQDFSIGTISISDTDFVQQNTCPATLGAGATCSIQVTFSPLSQGALSGTLTIPAQVNGGSQLTAALSGTATPGGAVVLTPLRLTFGNVLTGSLSAVQYITIANTGTAQIHLQAPVVSGIGFILTTETCGATLNPNFSCTAGVRFAPEAAGAALGTLTVTDDAGTQTAQLSGTGTQAATDTLAPSSLSFASQVVNTVSAPQSVMLSNDGDAALTQIGVTVSGDFRLTNGCGSSLMGHAQCALQVVYAPQTIGDASGQLTVADGLRTQVIALTGSGAAPAGLTVSPATLDFGEEGVNGTSQPQTVTLTNNGASALSGLQVQASGDFAITANGCAATVATASSCSIQVTFTPSGTGTRSGTLTLQGGSLPQPFSTSLSGMGVDFQLSVVGPANATVVGGATATYMLQLQPLGDSAGTITLTCAGAPAGSTCLVSPAPAPLTPGATTTLTVSIATAGQTAKIAPSARRIAGAMLGLLLPLGLPVVWRARRVSRLYCVLLLAGLGLAATGCGLTINGGKGSPGSSGGSGSGAVSGKFTMTVSAGAPGVQHSAALTLTVE